MMQKLEGKLVRLRPLKDDDYEYLASLKNNLMTQGWNQRLPPKATPEGTKENHKEYNKKPNSGRFAIETLDGIMTGDISYSEGYPRHDASFGLAIGVEYWGKGYAEEAQEILLNFLFVERGMAVVRLWTQTGFPWANRAAEKLGFKFSARFRENSIIDGKMVDCLCMDMLREEYFESRGLEDSVGAP